MIALAAAGVGAVVIALLLVVAVVGWTGPVSRVERAGLLVTVAGLCWAGPARYLGEPPGLGDILFLVGLALLVWARHGAAVFGALDRLDGAADGRIGRPPTTEEKR